MKIATLTLVISVIFIVPSCSERKEPNNISPDLSENEAYYEKCRKLVLSENKTSKTYNFIIQGTAIDEIELQYLGDIITSENDTLKIINSVNYTGLNENSKRANANVFIYKKNKRTGLYHLGHLEALPSKIKNNDLIFEYKNSSCNQTTVINLRDSIPKRIFVNCTDMTGDLYNLEN